MVSLRSRCEPFLLATTLWVEELTRDSSPLQTVVWHPLTNIGAVPASAGFNFGVYIDQSRIVKADDALPELQLSAPGI